MLEYLELAQLMQYSLHHPEGFVVVSTPAPDLIHSQAHEVVMDAHQQHVQVQLLHVVKPTPLIPADCRFKEVEGKFDCEVTTVYCSQTGLHGTNLKQVYGSQT